MENETQEPVVEDNVQPEPVDAGESPSPDAESDAPVEVVLTDVQWAFLHDALQWSLGLSLSSLLLVGAIFGAMLSHYLGRAVNRG